MKVISCPFWRCTFSTPEMESEAGACMMLLAHTQEHIVARMPPPLPPPDVAPWFLPDPLLIPPPGPVPPVSPPQMPALSVLPTRKRKHVPMAPDSRKPAGHRKNLEEIRRRLPNSAFNDPYQCSSLYSGVLGNDPRPQTQNGFLPSTTHADIQLSGSSDTDSEVTSEGMMIQISQIRSLAPGQGNAPR